MEENFPGGWGTFQKFQHLAGLSLDGESGEEELRGREDKEECREVG